jgi:5-methylcytosine-specific restriction protein A
MDGVALTVCAEPHCPHVAVDRGRCRQHQQRGTTSQRGYGSAYQRQRARYLREHPTCITCGQPATTVHHVNHDASTPAGLDQRRWQPMCLTCNSREAAGWGHPPKPPAP